MLGKKKKLALAFLAAAALALSGCGGQKAAAPEETLVKTMKVIQRDTPIVYEYSGFVEAQNEVQMKSRVTGMITEKHINGGDKVEKGQLMFVIDPRSYQAASLNYQAQLASAQANLSRIRRDAERIRNYTDREQFPSRRLTTPFPSLSREKPR
jgi:membrane fusion protein (multidrug efflux system)